VEKSGHKEHRCSSLTSDLSRSRRESLSLSAACGLLAGALRHAHGCVRSLSEQKAVLGRRLVERDRLELEVRKLADALGGERTEEEEEEERGRRARRSSFYCLTGAEVPERVFSRWLRSKSLSAIILSSMVDLQGALADSGNQSVYVSLRPISSSTQNPPLSPDSSPAHVMAAARSGFSRLLDQLLDQSARSVSSGSTLISGLQQHFLLFSQRLHAAEVERRSLRLEVSNLKKGLQQERVPTERFQTACEELRLSLNREQEAQELIQEQSRQLQLLQQRVDKLASEQHTLTHSKQLSRKESSLRILGKQLAGVQKEKRQLEQQLQGAEEQLRDAVSFLSVVSQLHQACCSRMDWLEQEVSAHHSHVTALRGELQDACLRENLAFIPVRHHLRTSEVLGAISSFFIFVFIFLLI
uniref:Coiled-coil domain containing 171 n=1 Tax=Xiphophorus couchianus TaxID=32473 RepID=A0A3B5M1Y0_9TELE